MKWIEILRKNDCALLQSESDTQYAVVSGYDPTQPEGQQWAHGTYFTYFQNNPKKILYLQSAYDCFMEKVNADFLSHVAGLKNLQHSLRIDLSLTTGKVQWNILMNIARCQRKRNLSLVLKKIAR